MNRNLATWLYMYATVWKIDICQSNGGTSQRIQSRIKPKIQWIEMTCRFKQKVNKEKFGFNMISSHWRTNNTHSCREIERNACAMACMLVSGCYLLTKIGFYRFHFKQEHLSCRDFFFEWVSKRECAHDLYVFNEFF